jgi:hypothetical protein
MVVDVDETVVVSFSVMRFPAEKRESVMKWARKLSFKPGGDPLAAERWRDSECDSREMNGWDTTICHGDSGHSAVILGATTRVEITGMVAAHLAHTPLGRFRDEVFEAMVNDFCRRNEPSGAAI